MPNTSLPGRSLLVAILSLAAACSSDAQTPSLRVREAFPKLFFANPVDLQHPGDGSNRLFVVEQGGTIRVFENMASADESRLFLDISHKLIFTGELGLLGLAFDPNYAENGYFYVNYTPEDPFRTVIARYSVDAEDPTKADPSSETIILEFDQPYGNHNGGQIAFGPDGYLYIASGDGGAGGDPHNYGQSLTTLLGKILRIDVHNQANGKQYAIPSDNPFADNNSGYREEIYAYGLRNPWRFSFDPATGRLWAGDVGQETWEEVDIIEKGRNYGWKIMEGKHCYPPPSQTCDTTGLTLPIWEYDRSQGWSITGGHVYRGSRIPELVGEYVYGDFGSGRIWGLRYDGTGPAVNRLLLSSQRTISSFGVDAEGELYFCSFDGRIYTFDITSGTTADKPATSARIAAEPNPFSGMTTLRYSIPAAARVQLIVRDLLGRVVAIPVDGDRGSGDHVAFVDGMELPGGLYLYSLVVDGMTLGQGGMLLVR